VAPRLKALRAAIAEAGLDGFLVPRADAHRGESVPDSEARLAYVTSFTGSAGVAVVGPKRAGLFIDSRYTLQAPLETDTRLVTVLEGTQGGVDPRLGDFVPKGGKLGFDPWLHTPGEIKELSEKLAGKVTLVPSPNLVDRIWTDRPAPPVSPVEFLGHNRAGRTAKDKLAEIRKALADENADVVVLTLPESINWLFNLRGRDVPNVPVMLGFALVPRTGMPTVFVQKPKLTPELRKGLAGVAKVADVSTLVAELRRLGAADKRVWIDPATAPLALVSALGGVSDATIVEKRDPVLGPKSRKNDAEIGGFRESHRLDGIAMAKVLCWFDREAPRGRLTEIGIVEALEHFRREEETCVDASFDTISGAGPNGAIVHYRVNEASNRTLKPGELMLLDSGAQYLSGTTDITRTMFTGKATAEQKDRFTRVLKGMIALTTVRYPKGTSGAQLDALARQFLWADGVTYNHGTGHGVGAFLGVHEGPAGFSPRYPAPLEAGMVISNEPGYYKAGAYGIRIENLVLVVESDVGEGRFLEHETLTLAPIDLRLIDDSLLLPPEREWLNAYHKRVFKEIGPALRGEVKAWLKDATRAI
jgi:Xaa-Pro aminopeptidase